MPVEEVLALSLQGAATVSPYAFICSFHRCSKLSVNFISFLHMATYMKSLAKRASLVKGSVKAMKASRAKVASLTFENADLRARVQRLGEDTVKYKLDLKHTVTGKARAQDKENKAWGELRAAEDALRAVRDELQLARDELHVVQDELHVKATTLSRVSQEAFKAVSSVEHLIKECHGLRGDLQRQEALVSQKERVIVELRNEACTLWAFGWLAFLRKASKVFSGLDFNFQVPVEGEAKESDFDDEADLMVLSDAPSSIPPPGGPKVETPVEVGSPTSVVGTSPSDLHAAQSLNSGI